MGEGKESKRESYNINNNNNNSAGERNDDYCYDVGTTRCVLYAYTVYNI